MFLKRFATVLLIFIVTATLVASPEMVARQTFAAILGGFAGSVSGAVIGTIMGGLINPTGWGDLVGLILRAKNGTDSFFWREVHPAASKGFAFASLLAQASIASRCQFRSAGGKNRGRLCVVGCW